jgi:porphobilinogen deaminase
MPDQLSQWHRRGEYRDALVHKKGKKLKDLTHEDTIGTSSLRRIASLKNLNNNIQIVAYRSS